MAKLQNIKAIRSMLDGTHRTQTRKSVAVNGAPTPQNREVGEIWEENGEQWVQFPGFKLKKGKLDEIRSKIEESRFPKVCPKCGNEMTKKLDRKFWKLEKHCFDCQVAHEHELRISGQYAQYERDRMKRNAEAWLRDAEQEAKEIVEVFRNPASFVNGDGTLEKWSGGMSAEEIATKIEESFSEFRDKFLSKF